jgi:hypothetical protein
MSGMEWGAPSFKPSMTAALFSEINEICAVVEGADSGPIFQFKNG